MICINPKERRRLDIDGASFTLRPLTWADRMSIAIIEDGAARALETVTRGVTDCVGVEFVGGKFDAAALPVDAALKLLQEINALSGVSETDRKNSSSPSAQNPAAASEPSTWTGNESAANTTPSFDPSLDFSALMP